MRFLGIWVLASKRCSDWSMPLAMVKLAINWRGKFVCYTGLNLHGDIKASFLCTSLHCFSYVMWCTIKRHLSLHLFVISSSPWDNNKMVVRSSGFSFITVRVSPVKTFGILHFVFPANPANYMGDIPFLSYCFVLLSRTRQNRFRFV